MSAVASQERLMQVLIGPHVSEKASAAGESSNQIVLKVRLDATKKEIRRAVETLFEVKVASVSVVRVHGKAKRFGARLGQRQDWKKAYIRLAPGQDIDFLETE